MKGANTWAISGVVWSIQDGKFCKIINIKNFDRITKKPLFVKAILYDSYTPDFYPKKNDYIIAKGYFKPSAQSPHKMVIQNLEKQQNNNYKEEK